MVGKSSWEKKDRRQGLLLVANCTRLAVAVSRFIYSLTNIWWWWRLSSLALVVCSAVEWKRKYSNYSAACPQAGSLLGLSWTGTMAHDNMPGSGCIWMHLAAIALCKFLQASDHGNNARFDCLHVLLMILVSIYYCLFLDEFNLVPSRIAFILIWKEKTKTRLRGFFLQVLKYIIIRTNKNKIERIFL
jgi:hypothetical protein